MSDAANGPYIASEGPGTLRVGAASRDITPASGIPMWGYADPGRVAEGVRDPLRARAVVFRAGGIAVGLAVLDLGRVPPPAVCQRLRESARAVGVDSLVLAATHTHSGPVMEEPDLGHMKGIADGVIEALAEADGRARPARVGVARAEIDIGFNRRVIRDGHCFMKWRNEERAANPGAPIDREAGILSFACAESGAPIATLVSFACHPVIFGPDNRRYSADWPGEMCRRVAASHGGECLLLQGATGDVNPYLDKTPLDRGADEDVHSEGGRAAEAVMEALSRLRSVQPGAPSVAYREESVRVGSRFDLSDPAQRKLVRSVYGPYFERYIADLPPDLAVPLGTLVLSGRLAVAFLPGEVFVEHQLDLKRRSPLRDTFLCGYANGYHAYFPTVRDVAYGGYGASTMSYVGLGAGETLVTRATLAIGELSGALRPFRTPEDFALRELPERSP